MRFGAGGGDPAGATSVAFGVLEAGREDRLEPVGAGVDLVRREPPVDGRAGGQVLAQLPADGGADQQVAEDVHATAQVEAEAGAGVEPAVLAELPGVTQTGVEVGADLVVEATLATVEVVEHVEPRPELPGGEVDPGVHLLGVVALVEAAHHAVAAVVVRVPDGHRAGLEPGGPVAGGEVVDALAEALRAIELEVGRDVGLQIDLVGDALAEVRRADDAGGPERLAAPG